MVAETHDRWMEHGPRFSPRVRTPIGPIDAWILLATLALLAVGIVMTYSATIGPADARQGDPSLYLMRELGYVGIGLVCLLVGAWIPFRFWRRLAYWVLLPSLGLLAAVLVVGKTYGNATRWLDVGLTTIQPSEIAKFAFVLFLARSITEKTDRMKIFSIGVLPHLVVFMALILSLLVQPDLGTCVILGLLMVGMLFVAGTRGFYVAGLFGFAAAMSTAFVFLSDERRQRILAYLDPWAYRYDDGFQSVNALTTLASGGVTGQGLGSGPQSLGGFLPEAESDFILPVIGEELGFLGVALVLCLFVLLIARGTVIACRCRDDFGRLFAGGLTLLIALQASVNAGVAVGLLPTKGLTLPLVSLGGTAMMVTMLSLGILLNISRESYRAEAAESTPGVAEEAS